MSAQVLLNLLEEFGKKIRCQVVLSIISVILNRFNKFNNTGAQMQDSFYHMPLNSLSYRNFCIQTSRFRHK